MAVARRLTVHGRVQGVFYRAWAVDTARDLGLTGWVRNRADGTVEALVQGDERDVERFIEWAKEGPSRASVARVDCSEAEPVESLESFRQLPTA